MDIRKDNAILQVHQDVTQMSELILWQLRELDNMLNSDEVVFDHVKTSKIGETETQIDKFEVKISEEFINLVCLHKPVASELRKVITCYRLSINLERIGDLTYKIIKIISEIKDHPDLTPFIGELSNMLTISNNMVEKSILSFLNQDIEYAIWTLKNDDVVDELNHKMIKKIIKKMNKGPFNDSRTMSNFIYLKTLVSTIERIADEATNIAEASIYYLRGDDVRHSGFSHLESEGGNPQSDENK